jgi:hypothetical protein
MNAFQSAIANWPEDEAYAIISDWREYTPENGYSHEDRQRMLEKDTTRMETLFMREPDGLELCARFRAALKRYATEWNLQSLS